MLTHMLRTVFACLLLFATTVALGQIWQCTQEPRATTIMQCGGQGECLEDRAFLAAEIQQL